MILTFRYSVPCLYQRQKPLVDGACTNLTFSFSLDRRKDAHELRDVVSRMCKVSCELYRRRRTYEEMGGKGETTAPVRFSPIRKCRAWAVEFVTRLHKLESSLLGRVHNPATPTGPNGHHQTNALTKCFDESLLSQRRFALGSVTL